MDKEQGRGNLLPRMQQERGKRMTIEFAKGIGRFTDGPCSSDGCDEIVDACCDYCDAPLCRMCRYDEENEGQELCTKCKSQNDEDNE